MNHKLFARYGNLLLRPLIHDDIEKLRIWRNDKQATRFLRPIGHITPAMQEEWFLNYLDNQNDIAFAIVETEELKRMVGSVSVYNIDGKTAEFGRIQIGEPQAHGKGIGRAATVMALSVGFRKLNLDKIYACVHRDNIAAHSIYMKVGFKIVGAQPSQAGGMEDLIEIDRAALLETNDYAERIAIGDNYEPKII